MDDTILCRMSSDFAQKQPESRDLWRDVLGHSRNEAGNFIDAHEKRTTINSNKLGIFLRQSGFHHQSQSTSPAQQNSYGAHAFTLSILTHQNHPLQMHGLPLFTGFRELGATLVLWD